MNTSSYLVGVRIDGNTAGLAKAGKEAQAITQQIGQQAVKEAQQSQRMVGGVNARAQMDFARMAKAREALGIRSEREIQREMVRTQAAYGRLARSGTMSFDEQRRAAARTREEVTRLTNEMGRLTGAQKLSRAGRIGGAVAVGVGTAAALVAPTVRKTMDYDLRVAHMANTAFNERDTAGRKAGSRELDAIIKDAVRFGGGTRDGAAETADTLFGSGIFKVQDIKAILRDAQMAGTANNADPAAFAQMAITANQTMGIPANRMGRVFGMATYAGQQGGFEVKDMAKWLPQQMAAAKSVGMYGEAGFAKLAALNQGAIVTAGTRDAAGNNVVNLLAKLGSQDTAKDFKKLGVNLPKKIAEGRMKGLDALDVLGNLLDSQLAKDKNYQNVQKQLRNAKTGSERAAALNSVGDIAMGTVIGKVFQDREALMALYGFMNGRDRVNGIARDSMNNADAGARNMDVIRDTPSFQMQRVGQERDMALQQSMDKLGPTIGTFSGSLSDLIQKYPGYTTAIVAATGALGALATSAGAFALFSWMGNRKGMPPGGIVPPGGIGPSGLSPTGSGLGTTFGSAGRLLGGLSTLAGPLMLIEALTGPSQEDIAKLRERDRASAGFRGKGFKDPRILGFAPTPSLNERLGGAAGQPYMPMDPLRGEILVRVQAAPGMTVEAEAKSNNPRIPMRAAVGRTNEEMGR